MIRFIIPIKLPSLANLRLHWRAMDSLKRKQKIATNKSMKGIPTVILPAIVTITRVGPRKLDDDNLASACKYVRDAIAAKIGVDDGSQLYTWRYEQRKGDYRVEIEIID